MTKKKSVFSLLGRYVSETIIIIIGISISFAISDWEKKRSARIAYQDYLQRLQLDIAIDSVQMVNDVRAYRRKIDGVNLVFAFHPGFSQDSIALLGQAQNALLNYVEFLPNDNTFQILSSTGDFNVFTNDSLVSELFRLYRYDYAFISMNGREANHERLNQVKPYLIDNMYYEDELTFPVVRTDIPAIVSDRYFRNICLEYQESCAAAIMPYSRAMQRLVRVNRMIREELLTIDR